MSKHVAQFTFSTFSAFRGTTPACDVDGIPALKTKDETQKVLAASFVFGHKALVMLGPATEEDPLDFSDLRRRKPLPPLRSLTS